MSWLARWTETTRATVGYMIFAVEDLFLGVGDVLPSISAVSAVVGYVCDGSFPSNSVIVRALVRIWGGCIGAHRVLSSRRRGYICHHSGFLVCSSWPISRSGRRVGRRLAFLSHRKKVGGLLERSAAMWQPIWNSSDKYGIHSSRRFLNNVPCRTLSVGVLFLG